MVKTTFKIIAIILLALFQVSFLSHFQPLREACNLALLGVILISVWIGGREGLYFGLLTGLCLDIYSAYAFGLITLSLTLPILLVNYAFKKILTHRSIYSTLLIVFSNTLIYWASLLIFSNLMSWLNWHTNALVFNYRLVQMVGAQVIFNIIATIIIYLFYKFVNVRFRLNFLKQA